MNGSPDVTRLARARVAKLALALALVVAVLAASSVGAAAIPIGSIARLLLAPFGADASGVSPAARAILLDVRLPRIALAGLVGAMLGMGGASIQGLFRNPLAEPGLVGVSGGGALGAALTIVVGAPLFAVAPAWLRPLVVPLGAFLGSLAITAFVLRIGTIGGQASAIMIILAGIAVNAFVGALIGLTAKWATDSELRDLVFWMLGSLGGATPRTLYFVAPFMIVPLALLPRFGKALNLLALGDIEASRLGVRTSFDKRAVVVLVALGVGASVSASGLIGFVGLVVPHVVRLVLGPDHRNLLVTSALFGAVLLVVADTIARTAVAPLELPIGALTALVGGPTFLSLLLRSRREIGAS